MHSWSRKGSLRVFTDYVLVQYWDSIARILSRVSTPPGYQLPLSVAANGVSRVDSAGECQMFVVFSAALIMGYGTYLRTDFFPCVTVLRIPIALQLSASHRKLPVQKPLLAVQEAITQSRK